jgi:chromate transport protein ChrA
MNRLVDSLQFEFAVFTAVLTHRPRSVLLLCTAFVLPTVFLQVAMHEMELAALPGLHEGIRPALGLISAVMLLKLLVLATQVYLKDRASWLET